MMPVVECVDADGNKTYQLVVTDVMTQSNNSPASNDINIIEAPLVEPAGNVIDADTLGIDEDAIVAGVITNILFLVRYWQNSVRKEKEGYLK